MFIITRSTFYVDYMSFQKRFIILRLIKFALILQAFTYFSTLLKR